MKHYFIYILLLAAGLMACNKSSDDKVFDQLPDERLNKALADYQAKLVAAPYGWKATVIPADTSLPYSFYFWFRFNNSNRVVSRMDTMPALESSYRMKALTQPELIFDTYTYLHLLADPVALVPGATKGKGISADFEFEVRYASADSIVLSGKYNGSKAVLIKAGATDSAGFTNGMFAKNTFLNGTYKGKGLRTNYKGPVADGIITGTNDLTFTKLVVGAYPGAFALDYANLGASGWQYIISFDVTTGKITKVGYNGTFAAGINPGTFKVTSATYDATLKQLYFKTEYTNTAGDARIVEETLTRQ